MKSLQKSFIIITVLAFGGAIATPALALSAANYSASLSIVAQLLDIADLHSEYRASIVPAVSNYLTSTSTRAELASYPIEQASIKSAASLMTMATANPKLSDSILPTVKASLTASSHAFASVAATSPTGGVKPIPQVNPGTSADRAIKVNQSLATVQQLLDLASVNPSASASIVSSLSTSLNTLVASADLVHFPKELAEIKAAASLVADIKSGQSSAEVVLPSVKATIASSQASLSATAQGSGTGGVKPISQGMPGVATTASAAANYANVVASVNQLVDLAIANPQSSDQILASVATNLATLGASAELAHYPQELAEIKAAASLVATITSGQASADLALPKVKASLSASHSGLATAASAGTTGTGGVKPIPATNLAGLSSDQAVRAQLTANKYASSLAVIKQIIDLGEGNDLSTDSIIQSVSSALDNLAASADLAQFPSEQAEIKALAALAASVKGDPTAAETVLPQIKASLVANSGNFLSLAATIKNPGPTSWSNLAALQQTGYASLSALQAAGASGSAAVNMGTSESAGQFITTGCFARSFASREQIAYSGSTSASAKSAMAPALASFYDTLCKSIF